MTGIADGQTQAVVSVSPSSIKTPPFVTTFIDIRIDSVISLFAASVTITFDSTILRYTMIQEGPFLTKNYANSVFLGIVPQPPQPAAPNRITIDQAIRGGGTMSGSGILFTVIFTAIRAGPSPIFITSTDIRNGSNTSIPVKTVSGKIIVNTCPSPVQLLSPQNGMMIDTSLRVTLMWLKSIDRDTGDSIRYEVHLMSPLSDLSFRNLSETHLSLSEDALKENTEYTWCVDATDGKDTISSGQKFKFKTPMLFYPAGVPEVFKVEQNFPNPFNQSTMIRFSVPIPVQVDVMVYDMNGREIIRLMSANVEAGYYSVMWDGKNSIGAVVGSGIYFYAVTAGWYREVGKMVFLK